MSKVKLGEKLIYYSGGYDKRSQDGVFTTVIHVTPTGRFKIECDKNNTYDADTLRRRGKSGRGFGGTPYCRLINEDNKKLEQRALNRIWIDRIDKINLEELSHSQLASYISFLNTSGIDNA